MTLIQERPSAEQDDRTAIGHVLPKSLRSASLARVIVCDELAGLPLGTVQTAQSLVSELVTNAVLHARSILVLRVTLAGDRLWIGVEDLSPDYPIPQQPAPDADDGRGLVVLGALAGAWGWDRTSAGGKEVWFELPTGF